MKRHAKGLFILAMAGVGVAAYQMGLKNYLTLIYLQKMSVEWHHYVSSHYWQVALGYIAGYGLLVTTAMPGVALLTLLGGFLFGAILGTVYSVIGAILGSLLFFSVIRFLLEDYVKSWKSERVEKMRNNVQKFGASYLLMLQFLTLVPYFIINTVAAVAHVPVLTFVWTTAVGALPLLFVYSFAGRQLGAIQSMRDIVTLPMLLAFVLLAFIAILPMIIRKIKGKQELLED